MCSAQQGPGVFLTFDDAYVEEWFSALPILERYGARATFYVCYAQRLSHRFMTLLRYIRMHGHEIGYHTSEHLRAPDVVAEHGLDGYFQSEIAPGLAALATFDLTPTSFAYPFGDHTDELDDFMLRHFKTVRATSREPQNALNSRTGNKVLRAASVDLFAAQGRPLRALDSVLQYLDLANDEDHVLGLYAHGISNTPTKYNTVTGYGLNAILDRAVSRGLRFFTADELA